MAVRKKSPPNIRKMLVQVLESAKLMRGQFEDGSKRGWLPTREEQVNQFIFERTQLWRATAIIQPLQTVMELIDEAEAK